LADWIRDLDMHDVFQIVAGLSRFPFFWRNDLKNVIRVFINCFWIDFVMKINLESSIKL
jgi:hypothetical protein